jgi:hypothetical protein
MRKRVMEYRPKIFIKDAEGIECAFVSNGVVYARKDGRPIASVQAGWVHGMDGQIIGRLAPRGAVLHEDGRLSEAFFRLITSVPAQDEHPLSQTVGSQGKLII